MDVDGSTTEVMVDMTPQQRAVETFVGGKVTFLGQWEPLEVFLLIRREDEAEAVRFLTSSITSTGGDADEYGETA